MIPVNQVILGGGDPLLGTTAVGNSIEEQLQFLERQKQLLEAARQRQFIQRVVENMLVRNMISTKQRMFVIDTEVLYLHLLLMLMYMLQSTHSIMITVNCLKHGLVIL